MAAQVGVFLLKQVGITVLATSFTAMAVGYLATTALTSILMKALMPKPSSGANRKK